MRKISEKKTKKIKIDILFNNESIIIKTLNIVMQGIIQNYKILKGIQKLKKYLI
jgi:hypothetical protein